MKAGCKLLLVMAVLCGMSSFALGDDLDFKMDVLDPPAFDPSYTVFVIQSTTFSVTFTPCVAGELPGGITADGCFAGVNNTGQTWTGLDMIFPNTAALGSQPASCAPSSPDSIFPNTSCGLVGDGSAYFLSYSGGIIPSYPSTPGDLFFIAESGVPAADFPTGTVTAEVMATTPEPGTLVFALTGVAAFGALSLSKLR
jgi:hypothetical protein